MGAFDLLAKAASKGAKKAAPFFSKADVVLDELQRNKGTGQEFLTEIVKKGAKPTELKERGIEKALKDKPKMTKAEVQKVFEQKAPPKVQEKVLSSKAPDYDEFLETKAQEEYGVDWFDLSKQERAKIEKMYMDLPMTQYDDYRTPGGENYREILLKLPSRGLTDSERWELDLYNRDLKSAGKFLPEKQARYEELKAKEANPDYVSGHYKADPNLLAHIRVQDFKTPDGKKVLLVDEIQSDWHQAGRDLRNKEIKRIMKETGVDKKTASSQVPDDFGYQSGEKLDPTKALRIKDKIFERFDAGEISLEQRNGLLEEVSRQIDHGKGVPDAPFKKNWHELSMKRVLDYAAENGYDSVAITPGKTQIDRYEDAVRKNIDSLEYEPYIDENGKQMFEVAGFKDGRQVFTEEDVALDRLQELMGKDTAQKISEGFGESLAQERPMRPEWRRIQSSDMSIGGEGMKGFYDKILPDYLNNYGKKYGSSVGQIELKKPITRAWSIEDLYRDTGVTPDQWQQMSSPDRQALRSKHFADFSNREEFENYGTFHSFDITPQMREEITTKGQPMYGKVAMPALEGLAAGTGAATMAPEVFNANNEQQVQNPVHFTENPDAMLLELMQRN
jgi:hypothetical protein